MRLLISLLFLFSFCSWLKAIEPLPEFIEIPIVRNIDDAGIFQDVMSRSQEEPFGNRNGRSTNVHETVHGIHATFRNIYSKKSDRYNALYFLNGKIALVKELNFPLSAVKQNIPECLQSYRYNLYFNKQEQYWGDRPTYILDEWTAYICSAESSLDDYARKIQIPTNVDEVSGCLDFSIYSVALYLTVKQRSEEYLAENPQFKRVLFYNLDRASKAFFEGRYIFKSHKQDELYNNLIKQEEAKHIRNCLKDEFDSMFLKQK